jgi:hypothetical protein
MRGELIWSFVAGAPDCIAPLGLSPFACLIPIAEAMGFHLAAPPGPGPA